MHFEPQKLHLWIYAVLLGSILSSPGCGNYLGGKENKAEVIQLSDPKLDCLKSFADNVRRYVLNDLSTEQTKATLTCVQDAAELFQKRTKGSGGDTYRTDELKRFFEKYFSKETAVSKELAQELMKFKKALVGGPVDVISKAEITKLIKLLEALKEEAVRLQPFIRTLFLQQKNPEPEEINGATQTLKKCLVRMLKTAEIASSDYTFEDAKYLLSLFSDYISAGRQVKQFSSIKKWLPIIESLRKLLVGESSSLKGEDDYIRLAENIADADNVFMHIYYRVRFFEYKTSKDVSDFGDVVEKVLLLLESSHQFVDQRGISFASIDQFLVRLAEEGLTPKKLSAKAIQDLYKALVSRNFDPNRRGDLRGLSMIERVHLSAMQREYRVWKAKQKWVDSLPFKGEGTITFSEVSEALKKIELNKWLSEIGINESTEVAYQKEAWTEFNYLFSGLRPVAFDSKSRFVVDYRTSNLAQTWKNLTQINIMHLVVRGLLQGYAANLSLINMDRYVTGPMLQTWYNDFNQLGIELKAFDRRTVAPGERSLLEANLFSQHGNGDERLDFYEAYDFLSVLIPGGLFVVSHLQETMAVEKCNLNTMDDFGFPWINEECFKKVLRKNFAKVFGNLPGMVKYLSGLTESQFEVFYEDLMTAARISPKQGQVETADIRTFVMMFHYAESLAIHFDTNQDGIITISELTAGSNRFHNLINSIVKLKLKDADGWAINFIKKYADSIPSVVSNEIFLFMVLEGKKFDLKAILSFENKRHTPSLINPFPWMSDERNLIRDANRSSIVRTFRLIKEQ